MRARKKVKAQIEKAARETHVAKFNHRMDLVKQGALALKKKDYRNALQYFLAYLDVLEKAKGGTLTPKSFDPKTEAAEMLMATGVFWDVAKIYDMMTKKEIPKVQYHLDKFVLFSKGTNYQRLSVEMLRKCISNGKLKTSGPFKEAYVKLGGGRCFVATAVEEHCDSQTVYILKRYRDEVLSKNRMGRVFTRVYYQISPLIAIRLIRSSEQKQKRVARILGFIANAISCRFFPGEK